jgi:hypothetical protein
MLTLHADTDTGTRQPEKDQQGCLGGQISDGRQGVSFGVPLTYAVDRG